MFQWLNDRTGAITAWKTFWYWTVPATKCIFRLMPVMIIFGFLIQAITGILMWAHYSPSSQTAWESVYFFQYHIPLGWLIRGMHHYSAQLLVGILGFYILASVFRRSYRAPYEFVFWSALVLLIISLCSCLTGDLLNWSLSGYSATLVRVRFLQMIPVIGDSLFKLVVGGPGPGFGTMTLTRFTVLHIMVFGGGFFVFLVLWRFFDARSRKMEIAKCAADQLYDEKMERKSSCCCNKPLKLAYLWSTQLFWSMMACVVFLIATLGLVHQHEMPGILFGKKMEQKELPKEFYRGAKLMSPADPATSYDAARPEWSLRAVYHFSNQFPADYKFYSIFVIPPLVFVFLFLIPIIGKIRIGHWFNVLVMCTLLVAFCVMTWLSYDHDWKDPNYVAAVEEADALSVRAIELVQAPTGIPPAGALTLMQNDPKVQGPALFNRHCATCHAFAPFEGEEPIADFKPIVHPAESNGEPWRATAPNLYNPVRAKWISGYMNKDRLLSDDYFGNTAFKTGQMVTYMSETFPAMKEDIGEMMAEDFELESFDQALDLIVEMLLEEARRDEPRKIVDGLPEGINPKHYELFGEETGLGCDATGCHKFYGLGSLGPAPDLTGYMSRDWLFGVIANAGDSRFYGDKNDKMPVYFVEGSADSTLTKKEVELLTDWLRGTWYRPDRPMKQELVPDEAVSETTVETKAETTAETKVEPPAEVPSETEPAVSVPEEKPAESEPAAE